MFLAPALPASAAAVSSPPTAAAAAALPVGSAATRDSMRGGPDVEWGARRSGEWGLKMTRQRSAVRRARFIGKKKRRGTTTAAGASETWPPRVGRKGKVSRHAIDATTGSDL